MNKQMVGVRYRVGPLSIQSSEPNTTLASASAAALHIDAAVRPGLDDSAPLTCDPERFDGAELPHISKLRKYAFTS